MTGFLSAANFARVAKVVALLFFLTPWVTVSCSTRGLDQVGAPSTSATPTADTPIAKATGFQLAIGSISYADSAPFPSSGSDASNPLDKPNLLVVAGGLLILLSLAATFFFKGGRRVIAAIIGVALAAAALCYAVLIQVPATALALFRTRGGEGIEFHVSTEIGFWLTLSCLATAIMFNLIYLNGDIINLILKSSSVQKSSDIPINQADLLDSKGRPTNSTQSTGAGPVLMILGAILAGLLFVFVNHGATEIGQCYYFGREVTSGQHVQCYSGIQYRGAWTIVIISFAIGAFLTLKRRGGGDSR